MSHNGLLNNEEPVNDSYGNAAATTSAYVVLTDSITADSIHQT